jgi:hypothetical protein
VEVEEAGVNRGDSTSSNESTSQISVPPTGHIQQLDQLIEKVKQAGSKDDARFSLISEQARAKPEQFAPRIIAGPRLNLFKNPERATIVAEVVGDWLRPPQSV